MHNRDRQALRRGRHHRPHGLFRRYAWPSANRGSMHIAGGASAAYRREIESADDPEAKRQEIEARLQAIASPFRTAEATGQDIIDPRETRAVLSESSRTHSRACVSSWVAGDAVFTLKVLSRMVAPGRSVASPRK